MDASLLEMCVNTEIDEQQNQPRLQKEFLSAMTQTFPELLMMWIWSGQHFW